MPELPEVETVRRGLLGHLPGRRIASVQVFRPQSIELPAPRTFAARLKNVEFRDVRRRGKYLLLDLSAGMLVVHLRMSGKLLFVRSASEASASADKRTAGNTTFLTPYERVRFNLVGESKLIFDDMRVFGRVWYLAEGKTEQEISGIADLGPEPLPSLCARYLSQKLANKSQAIKTALLDQTIVAGIGNIYADEILHLSGILPSRSAGSLTGREIAKVIENTTRVLEHAILAGGSTIRDYKNSEGVNGNYQGQAFVYGRKGSPCRQCKSPVERIKLGGRSSHYCPSCQS